MGETESGSAFSVTWLGIAFVVGVTLQVIGWTAGIGIFTGLPAYFLVGLLTAWGSPGNTLLEPGIAAFFIALAGYLFDHLLLTIFVVGIPVTIAYAVAGMFAAVLGASFGEHFLD